MFYGHRLLGSICLCQDSLFIIPASHCSCKMICLTFQIWQVHLHILFWHYSNVFLRHLFKTCFTFLLILEETRAVWDVPLVCTTYRIRSWWISKVSGVFFHTFHDESASQWEKNTEKHIEKGHLPFLKETKEKPCKMSRGSSSVHTVYFGLVW